MVQAELLQTAARLVVDEGMEYAQAKRRALKHLGLPPRTPLPSNDELEDLVVEHIALFHAQTQPGELAILRTLALKWMQRMVSFQPHLSGAVWQGTATKLTDVFIQLFCDDSKAAEIELINRGQHYEASSTRGFNGQEVGVLTVDEPWPGDPQHRVGIHLLVYDLDDLRGALKPDTKGRVPRGSLAALTALLNT